MWCDDLSKVRASESYGKIISTLRKKLLIIQCRGVQVLRSCLWCLQFSNKWCWDIQPAIQISDTAQNVPSAWLSRMAEGKSSQSEPITKQGKKEKTRDKKMAFIIWRSCGYAVAVSFQPWKQEFRKEFHIALKTFSPASLSLHEQINPNLTNICFVYRLQLVSMQLRWWSCNLVIQHVLCIQNVQVSIPAWQLQVGLGRSPVYGEYN